MFTLVIVDDDSLALKFMVSAFPWEEMGFIVENTFTKFEGCLNYLKTHPVDALLTDIKMPGISGLDLAKICSKLYPDMGIVLISAFSNFEYAREAFKYNVIDYLLKPIDEKELESTMERLKKHIIKLKGVESSNSVFLGTDNASIAEIKRYVSTHYQNSITLNDVAEHVMMNPNYLGNYFKKKTGLTFRDYLLKTRMEKACELLKDTDLKIAVIAEKVSYKTTTPFFNFFYAQYHMTPAEYRKKYQRKDLQ